MLRTALLVSAVCLLAHGRAEAQLGTLLSPGVLTKAHAELEGIANCSKCHEPGKGITAAKCLSCHKPVADRIARRSGVHRDVKGDCVSCHVEHTGADGELRPFDRAAFDHAGVAGFPLDGRHAALAGKCEACHKTRSFLTVRADCQSCHKDAHNGKLGAACASCHTTRVAFKDVIAGGRFDHSKTAFPLMGAHKSVTCASCHVNGAYKGLSFSSCTSCHKDPHQPTFGAVCTTCHTTDAWRTTKVDHSRTAFPLLGRHAAVACASCHKQSALKVKPRSNTCAACHVDVHRGTFKQDCKSCHTETSFAKAPFDHGSDEVPARRQARAARLRGVSHPAGRCGKDMVRQRLLPRSPPRRSLRRRGPQISADCVTTCVSCHSDVHKGEMSATCESCHTTATFAVNTYRHLRTPEFFAGQHASVACGACHLANQRAPANAPAARPAVLNVKFAGTATSCVSCHKDVHLGQVRRECESCHSVQTAKFGVVGFSHVATVFPLTGKHAKAECAACHKVSTGVFPAGSGTAVRLKGVAMECRACHQDVHLGQVEQRCESCHSTDSFAVPGYKHRTTQLRDFFIGRHVTAECASCHVPVHERFSRRAGQGHGFQDRRALHRVPSRRAQRRAARLSEVPQAMNRLLVCAALAFVTALCLAVAQPVRAQFETPNRSFHETTAFRLEGRHLTVACASCHINGQYQGTPATCYACHWVRRKDDRYQTRLGTQCEQCHQPVSWTAVRWEHASTTGVALNASHRSVSCVSCHRNGNFNTGMVVCSSCHRKDYDATRSPNHAAAGFSVNCESCHRPGDATWRTGVGGDFNHNAVFPLQGIHATVSCTSCHRSNVYKGTGRECVSCHQADYNATKNPNHAAAGFSTACETCHRPGGPQWRRWRRHVLQSQRRLPAGGRACHAGVRVVPSQQRVQGHGARLRRLPSGRLQPRAESESRGRGLLDVV